MIILGIDSSTDYLALGLGDESKVISEKVHKTSREHASKILGLVDDLMTENSMTINRIDGIAVAIGPGSFTGLRIGMAVAKGIAVSNNIPVVGISTFEVIARRLLPTHNRFFLMAPVRRGEYYLCHVSGDGGILQNIVLVVEERLAEKVGKVSIGYIGGEPPDCLRETMNMIDPNLLSVSGGELARMGAVAIAGGQSEDITDLEPLYIAQSQAEIKFDNR